MQITADIPRLLRSLRYAFHSPTSVLGELLQNGRRAGASRILLDITCHMNDGPDLQVSPDIWTDMANTTYGQAYRTKYKGKTIETIDITVTDDGCGIEDFAVLFHLGASGWSEEVIEQEMPYGLGFLSALLCAPNVDVLSQGKRMYADTEDLLAGRPGAIQIVDGPPSAGTVISLLGIPAKDMIPDPVIPLAMYGDCPLRGFLVSLQNLISGFPLPVWLGGERRIPAPFALRINGGHARHYPDMTAVTGCPVDMAVRHRGAEAVSKYYQTYLPFLGSCSGERRVYLQGLPVTTPPMPHAINVRIPSHSGSYGHVPKGEYLHRIQVQAIHLDSKVYRGKLPDRSHLYDAIAAGLALQPSVMEDMTWYARNLVRRKETAGAMDFWNTLSEAALPSVFSSHLEYVYGMERLADRKAGDLRGTYYSNTRLPKAGALTLAEALDAAPHTLCIDVDVPYDPQVETALYPEYQWLVRRPFPEVYPGIPVTLLSKVLDGVKERVASTNFEDYVFQEVFLTNAAIPVRIHRAPVPSIFYDMHSKAFYVPEPCSWGNDSLEEWLRRVYRAQYDYSSIYLDGFIADTLSALNRGSGYWTRKFIELLSMTSSADLAALGDRVFTVSFVKGEVTNVSHIR